MQSQPTVDPAADTPLNVDDVLDAEEARTEPYPEEGETAVTPTPIVAVPAVAPTVPPEAVTAIRPITAESTAEERPTSRRRINSQGDARDTSPVRRQDLVLINTDDLNRPTLENQLVTANPTSFVRSNENWSNWLQTISGQVAIYQQRFQQQQDHMRNFFDSNVALLFQSVGSLSFAVNGRIQPITNILYWSTCLYKRS